MTLCDNCTLVTEVFSYAIALTWRKKVK